MFYQMITTARDHWFESQDCTVNHLITYIKTCGQMRDAQIDAIKTYLYLKIACESRPLAELFCQGAFNTLSLDEIEVSAKVRGYLESNTAAVINLLHSPGIMYVLILQIIRN